MGRPIKVLTITDQEKITLQKWLRRRQMPAAEQMRARTVLLGTSI